MSILRIYFDSCCLNRPYDDLRDNAVRMEAEAVLSIIDYCESGHWEYFSSDVLLDELLEMTNHDKRDKVLLLYRTAALHIDLTDEFVARAKEYEKWRIKSYDALHLAGADIGGANILLTADKKFIRAAERSHSRTPVRNPLNWLAEVLYDSER